MATEVEFNGILINARAFGQYTETLPHQNRNALIKSGVFTSDPRVKALLQSQVGSYYGMIPMKGRIGGEPVNYDGETDIPTTGIGTCSQGVIAYGRAKGWEELDFTTDISAGEDPLTWMGQQIADYWDDVDTKIVMGVTKGLFGMGSKTDATDNEKFFSEKHTLDVSDTVDGVIIPETLNNLIQQASGDKRGHFTTVFMHSTVAKNLENQKLLEWMKGTDANGIQRDLTMATWNGRTVIVDDGMPYDPETGLYTTYVFGRGAFSFDSLGAKVPMSISRDEAKRGGITYLYNRRRNILVPRGISFIGNHKLASLSPTDAELFDHNNWEIITNHKTGSELQQVEHRDIPIARIISKG
jgi:hypothetical protein